MMILLGYFIKVNAVFAVLFLVYYLFLRKEKFLIANRVVLWTIVIASFILPLSPAVYHQSFAEKNSEIVVKPVDLLPASFNFSKLEPENNKATVVQFKPTATERSAGWITVTYIIVAIFLFARFLIRLVHVYAILSTSRRLKTAGIVYCEPVSATSPFSFFNFIVVSAGIEKEKYRQIIAHERAHCTQGHSFDLLLSDLTAVLLWINPLVYMYRREVSLNLEYLADEATLAQGIDARNYQLTLLTYSDSLPFNFPATPFASRLRKRIGMMNTTKPAVQNGCRYAALLPALFLMSMLTGFKVAGPIPAKENTEVKIVPEKQIVRSTNDKAAKADVKIKTGRRQENQIPKESPKEIIKAIHINATTDTVKFKFTNAQIAAAKPFDGIYVIGDKIIPAADIRKAMQPTGELTFILSSRPAMTFYSADSQDAIEKWGEQAKRGVILLQPRASETGRVIEATLY